MLSPPRRWHDPRDQSTRFGLTLVEVLVSFGVIGLLMALLLPAVMSSREAARKTQCRNNLRQIGVAIHSFHEQRGFLDTQLTLMAILPHMGEVAIAAEFNAWNAALSRGGSYSLAGVQSPTTYVCPSDFLAERSKWETNYVINFASPLDWQAGFRQRGEKPFHLSLVTDGLSNTAIFSEKLVPVPNDLVSGPIPTPDVARRNPLRSFFSTDRQFTRDEHHAMYLHCMDPAVREQAGTNYWTGINMTTGSHYHHLVPPQNWSFGALGRGDGPIAPSSLHGSGVHVLFADGHVDFVSQDIDYRAFWKMGTIASQDEQW